jgi:hypothetical protein
LAGGNKDFPGYIVPNPNAPEGGFPNSEVV